mmetsp:Transcript_24347/g.57517  ORF Transcript_24347/g.57517 Transcript_24347/m.57517 type:complete len:354 (-) Transcript_24347:69-1130(-)
MPSPIRSPRRSPASGGFLCQTLRADLEQVAAQFPSIETSARTRSTPTSARSPVDDIAWNLERIEGLWRYVQRVGVVGEEDPYLGSCAAELDQQVAALERQLEAVRREHRRGRARLLRRTAQRRQEALAARAAAEGTPPALDARRLVDAGEFDPGEAARAAAEEAAAPIDGEAEAKRAELRRSFELQKGVLEAKIREACEGSRRDQEQHDLATARLEAKLQAARAEPQPRGQPTARRRRPLPPPGTWPLEDVEEVEPVRQWGGLVVSWLGLTSYPSKPRRWSSCMTTTNRRTTPRVARSVEEAFAIAPEELPGGLKMDGSLSELSTLSGHLRAAGSASHWPPAEGALGAPASAR